MLTLGCGLLPGRWGRLLPRQGWAALPGPEAGEDRASRSWELGSALGQLKAGGQPGPGLSPSSRRLSQGPRGRVGGEGRAGCGPTRTRLQTGWPGGRASVSAKPSHWCLAHRRGPAPLGTRPAGWWGSGHGERHQALGCTHCRRHGSPSLLAMHRGLWARWPRTWQGGVQQECCPQLARPPSASAPRCQTNLPPSPGAAPTVLRSCPHLVLKVVLGPRPGGLQEGQDLRAETGGQPAGPVPLTWAQEPQGLARCS